MLVVEYRIPLPDPKPFFPRKALAKNEVGLGRGPRQLAMFVRTRLHSAELSAKDGNTVFRIDGRLAFGVPSKPLGQIPLGTTGWWPAKSVPYPEDQEE